ncbi:hypothetical protein U9M48_034210 [Paspalum notatum var. saurae]|uniref:Uncharacterized protein n=1 Tax=Paspalum notatum var. saurae TaxID=547442 RepID=A0AAQ3U8N3_PASNO
MTDGSGHGGAVASPARLLAQRRPGALPRALGEWGRESRHRLAGDWNHTRGYPSPGVRGAAASSFALEPTLRYTWRGLSSSARLSAAPVVDHGCHCLVALGFVLGG